MCTVEFNTLPSYRNNIKMPIFMYPGLDVSFEVKSLKEAMSNILVSQIDIADGHYRDSMEDCVENIDELLSIDALHHF